MFAYIEILSGWDKEQHAEYQNKHGQEIPKQA